MDRHGEAKRRSLQLFVETLRKAIMVSLAMLRGEFSYSDAQFELAY
jgi:hypothetical protein